MWLRVNRLIGGIYANGDPMTQTFKQVLNQSISEAAIDMPSERLALMIDLERCTGCKSCEAACKTEHRLGPGEYRNKVVWVSALEQAGLAFVVAPVDLAVYQQRHSLLKADGAHARLGELLLQSSGHARQAQTAQLFNRRVHHHGLCLS